MKRLFFFAAATAVALSSCSKDEVTATAADAQNEIKFSTYSASATKTISEASLTTNGFTLDVIDASDDVIYNDIAATVTGTAVTTTNPSTLYWPSDGENLDFLAFYGLTQDDTTPTKFTHTADGTTDPIMCYMEDVTKQTTAIGLTFKHALAKVITVVKDNNTDDDLVLYITSVSYAVNTGGTCTVTLSSTTWEDNTTGSFDAFSNSETLASSVTTTDFTAIPQEDVTVTIKGCWKQGDIVIEDFTETGKTATVSPAAANSAYTYTYEITPNVTAITFTAEIDSNGWDDVTAGEVAPVSTDINKI